MFLDKNEIIFFLYLEYYDLAIDFNIWGYKIIL